VEQKRKDTADSFIQTVLEHQRAVFAAAAVLILMGAAVFLFRPDSTRPYSEGRERPSHVTTKVVKQQPGKKQDVPGERESSKAAVSRIVPNERGVSRPSESPDPQTDVQDQIRKKLLQPVAFEFDCEPLRDVLNFLRTVTGLKILTNEDIFEELGDDEDCYGTPVERKELFISVHVNELSLESALSGMLGQHGLGFSLEPDYIYISFQEELPESTSQASSAAMQDETDELLLQALSEPVAFEFDCKPLRDVLSSITTISGITIFVDEYAIEDLGVYEDCYGNPVDRKNILVTFHGVDLPLESALDSMLEEHGLGFSIEGDYSEEYLYVFQIGSPKAQSTEAEFHAGELHQPVEPVGGTRAGWPEIEVKSVFDPTRSGNHVAILKIGNKSSIVKAGDRSEIYEILKIDGKRNCVTVGKFGPRNTTEEREFCKE